MNADRHAAMRGNDPYDNRTKGFRPLVCLKSNVTLKQVEGGYEIMR